MRLPKTIVGKQVRVRWRDPRCMRVETDYPDSHEDIRRGRQTLATWTEWGLAEDITEGVLHLLQGVADDPLRETHRHQELTYSVIPEELIEAVTVLDDQQTIPAPERRLPEGRTGGVSPSPPVVSPGETEESGERHRDG